MEQLALLGRQEPAFDERFSRLERRWLPEGAWLDYQPDFLTGHAGLLDHLERSMRWRHDRTKMYDKVLDVPRLFAVLPDDGEGHPIIARIRDALCQRYGQMFVRISMALYRNGGDSVAWHGDRVARRMPEALVATVSLGAARKFLLRPYGGGRSIAYSLGMGDLLVMGGSCQRTWQHSVPKVRHADPRLAIMFRPVWAE